MYVRIPVKLMHRPEHKRGPTGNFFVVGVDNVEFGEDADPSADPTGFLPPGFPQVGTLAGVILEAAEEAGYDPDDYELSDDETSRRICWAVVEEELSHPDEIDGDDWVHFEDAESRNGND